MGHVGVCCDNSSLASVFALVQKLPGTGPSLPEINPGGTLGFARSRARIDRRHHPIAPRPSPASADLALV